MPRALRFETRRSLRLCVFLTLEFMTNDATTDAVAHWTEVLCRDVRRRWGTCAAEQARGLPADVAAELRCDRDTAESIYFFRVAIVTVAGMLVEQTCRNVAPTGSPFAPRRS